MQTFSDSSCMSSKMG